MIDNDTASKKVVSKQEFPFTIDDLFGFVNDEKHLKIVDVDSEEDFL